MDVGIIFSDTGGGHRSAALALEAAFREVDPSVRVRVVDGLVQGGSWPLNRAPRIYEWWMRRARWLWGFCFFLSNGPFRARLMADLGYPFTRRQLQRLVASLQVDLLVSTHPLLTRTISHVLRKSPKRPVFAVVVTDMVTGHWTWYDRDAAQIYVPTEEARAIMQKGGFDERRITVTGQMVHPRCGRVRSQRDVLRQRFGWTTPVIILIGGGEGMGRLGEIVRSTAAAGLPARLVAICGRNESLRASLAAEKFSVQVDVFGFVDNLHELLAAADILITKGGPGSIMEGAVAGLPMLIYDYIPGQEIGNLRLVESRGFGHYTPRREAMIERLRFWLENPEARSQAAAAALEFGEPNSALRAAENLLALTRSIKSGNSPSSKQD